MKDLGSSVVKRHLEGEEKTAEQMINMIRMVRKEGNKRGIDKEEHTS